MGVAGDVLAVVDGVRSTLVLTDDDLSDLYTGLTKAMAAYDKMGIYNFNMNFFTGSETDDFARFHLLFSPQVQHLVGTDRFELSTSTVSG